MSKASPEKKDSILKTLAIIGFTAIIILIAWLSIQFVQVLPNAFSSLASLAEGVNQYQQSIIETEPNVPIVVTSNTTLINSGDEVNINWDTAQTEGTYTFAYECTDGMAVDIVSEEGLQSIECDTNYNVGNTSGITIEIDSMKNRYSDLSYSIAFLRTEDTEPRASGDATITVLNTDISNVLASATTEEEVKETESATEEEEVAEEPVEEPTETTPEVSEPVTPEPVTPVTPEPEPVFEQEFVYQIPVSDPDGRTDLSVRFIDTGEITNNRFVSGSLDSDEAGAIQFEVRNLGTKTSDEWTYEVELPNGMQYESPEQDALKPNERAVITVGFPASEVDSHTFDIVVDEPTDRNTLNDFVREPVTF